uniref:G-protein coupled receptors family 1 profile domain-containing protein n=1 Tax=Onchocerca volvulus TaxID=6282 RepID=A0A8R1TPB0_ONCVO
MDSCKEASELAHSIVFNSILVVVIVISTIAIFLEIWIMFKTTNRILLHQNIRILIIVHQLWLILHCIARIFAHSYVLVAYWKTHADPCEYMALPWECFMMRTPTALTLFLNAASIPSIVIERAFATYFSSRYEKFGKSIAVILIIAQFAIGIGSFLFIAGDFKFDSEKAVYCSKANDENATKAAVTLGFYIAIDFISVLTFPVLFLINKAISIHYFLLCGKFHLNSGIQQTPTYALTLPIAIVWTEKYVRKTTQKNRQKAMELKGNEAADHYFVSILIHLR